MVNMPAQNAARVRADFSRFVVHLTRNDKDTFPRGGETARNNFVSILKSRIIRPFRPHCLFNRKLGELPKRVQSIFSVACFTEVPLDQIHLLTGPIEGRKIKLEPYGFVFTREFIIQNGGQPAIYVNSYEQNMWLRESVDAIFASAQRSGDPRDPVWRLFPYVNAMHERCDFSWEREWRCHENVRFKESQLVCLILPDSGEEDFRKAAAKSGTAVISPGWTYEQIISELSKQQRATRRIHVEGDILAEKDTK